MTTEHRTRYNDQQDLPEWEYPQGAAGWFKDDADNRKGGGDHYATEEFVAASSRMGYASKETSDTVQGLLRHPTFNDSQMNQYTTNMSQLINECMEQLQIPGKPTATMARRTALEGYALQEAMERSDQLPLPEVSRGLARTCNYINDAANAKLLQLAEHPGQWTLVNQVANGITEDLQHYQQTGQTPNWTRDIKTDHQSDPAKSIPYQVADDPDFRERLSDAAQAVAAASAAYRAVAVEATEDQNNFSMYYPNPNMLDGCAEAIHQGLKFELHQKTTEYPDAFQQQDIQRLTDPMQLIYQLQAKLIPAEEVYELRKEYEKDLRYGKA